MKIYDIIKKSLALFLIIGLVATPFLAYAQEGGLVPCGGSVDSEGRPVGDFCTLSDAVVLVVSVINIALQLAGLVAVVMIMIGGLKMISLGTRITGEGDNKKSVTAGKKTIFYAITGLLLILASYSIINGIWGLILPDQYSNTWAAPWQ